MNVVFHGELLHRLRESRNIPSRDRHLVFPCRQSRQRKKGKKKPRGDGYSVGVVYHRQSWFFLLFSLSFYLSLITFFLCFVCPQKNYTVSPLPWSCLSRSRKPVHRHDCEAVLGPTW